ncbi:MAG TPA: Uma2 family endonuclease [Chloroflexota bacterium]|nr:Uma2 family endonuclease [Chloroflexota bacterium]
MINERSMTVEEFERIAPLLDGPSELVDGRLRLMSPTSYRHGLLSGKMAYLLCDYATRHPGTGEVVGAETGFRINHPRYPVQAPDAGFIRAGRAPGRSRGAARGLDSFMHGAPDLAVEVRSPDERLAAIQARALRWLEAGSQAVWIVDGRREVVHRLHRGTPPRILNSADLLEEPEVLPGFSVLVAELFARTL